MKGTPCQTENPDDKKYCRECGADLVYPCPQCGSEVLASDKFCGDCRYDLRKSKEAAAANYSEPQS
jgi:hypothetical protein